MSDLSKCLYCGGNARAWRKRSSRKDWGWRQWQVRCYRCGIAGPRGETEKDAVEHWEELCTLDPKTPRMVES